MLRIHAAGLREIKLADSNDLTVGEFALAIGNPLGLGQSATMGIVSTLHRNVFENGPAAVIVNMIQTSAPINLGNSGGALVDLNGRLAGVPTLAAVDPTFGEAAQGIGFAAVNVRGAGVPTSPQDGGVGLGTRTSDGHAPPYVATVACGDVWRPPSARCSRGKGSRLAAFRAVGR